MLHSHSPLEGPHASQETARTAATAFTPQASTTALAVELALMGKADERNLSRAATEIRRTRHDTNGAFQRTLALTHAARGSEDARNAIAAFGEKLWGAGLDLKGRGLGDADYDPSIKHALHSEGIVVDYLTPPELRGHARTVIHAVWEGLLQSSRFTEGMRALETPQPLSPTKVRAWEDTVRHFDRDFLAAAEALRWAIVDAFATSGPKRARGESIVGPTVSSQNAVEALFLSELLGRLPDNLQTKVVDRYRKMLTNITIRDYLLKEHQSMCDCMHCLVDLPNKLRSGLSFLEARRTIQEGREALRELGSLRNPECATFSHLSAPPQYRVSYVALHPSEEPLRIVTFYHTHSIAFFQIREDDTEKTMRWGVDISGAIRSLPHGIPFDETDLNMSKGQFADFSRDVRHGALGMLSKLMGIWERFPKLFTAPLQGAHPSPLLSDLAISDAQGYLSLRVSRDHQHALAAAILGPSTSDRTFQGHITVASDPGAAVFEVHVPLTPTETEEEGATEVALEPNTSVLGLSDQFISDYCPHYHNVVNLLGEHFGVTEISGKGSHMGLCLNGRKYPTSKKMRDGTYPITVRFIRSILEQLEISEDSFVGAVER